MCEASPKWTHRARAGRLRQRGSRAIREVRGCRRLARTGSATVDGVLTELASKLPTSRRLRSGRSGLPRAVQEDVQDDGWRRRQWKARGARSICLGCRIAPSCAVSSEAATRSGLPTVWNSRTDPAERRVPASLLGARGESQDARIASAVGPDARRTDAGDAGTSARRSNAADGPTPPQAEGRQGLAAQPVARSRHTNGNDHDRRVGFLATGGAERPCRAGVLSFTTGS